MECAGKAEQLPCQSRCGLCAPFTPQLEQDPLGTCRGSGWRRWPRPQHTWVLPFPGWLQNIWKRQRLSQGDILWAKGCEKLLFLETHYIRTHLNVSCSAPTWPAWRTNLGKCCLTYSFVFPHLLSNTTHFLAGTFFLIAPFWFPVISEPSPF